MLSKLLARVSFVWLWVALLWRSIRAEENGAGGSLTLHKRVEAAVILDEKHRLNARGRRRYAHCREFMRNLFQNNNLTITIDPPAAAVEGGDGEKYDPKRRRTTTTRTSFASPSLRPRQDSVTQR